MLSMNRKTVKRYAAEQKTVMGRDLGLSILGCQNLGCQKKFIGYG